MSLRLEPLPLHGPLFEGAIAVYSAAFAQPPYSDPQRGSEVRRRIRDVHARRPGFRGVIALEHERLVGMIYGYRGEAGQWWHDSVVHSLSRAAAIDWLADSYELVEVAVDPDRQGKGTGTALIERLLLGTSEATCVLSTRNDSRAHILYTRLGFELIAEMRFAAAGGVFYIMGKRLR